MSARGEADGWGCAGFSLVETMIGLALFALLTAASIPLFIGTIRSSNGLGTKQAGITIANQWLEYARSIAPASLVKGRHATNVAALIAAPTLADLSDDVTASGNSDPAAVLGSAAAVVPLTTTQSLAGTTFTVRTYINQCYLSRSDGSCTPLTSNGSMAYRVSVDVTWPQRPGVECAAAVAGQCEYVVVTLIDPSSDPVFSLTGTPTITAVRDGGSTPATVLGPIHPGQQLTLLIQGIDFAAGAGITPSSGDAVGTASGNTGTSLTVDYRASSTLGARSLSVINPSGASGSTTLSVTTSAPTVTALNPTSAPRLVATTFTVTGTDIFATPSLSTQTVKPTLAITASSGGVTFTPTVTNIAVVSSTSLTFRTTLPFSIFPYNATGTLTLTNPDGGTVSYAFTVRAT